MPIIFSPSQLTSHLIRVKKNYYFSLGFKLSVKLQAFGHRHWNLNHSPTAGAACERTKGLRQWGISKRVSGDWLLSSLYFLLVSVNLLASTVRNHKHFLDSRRRRVWNASLWRRSNEPSSTHEAIASDISKSTWPTWISRRAFQVVLYSVPNFVNKHRNCTAKID